MAQEIEVEIMYIASAPSTKPGRIGKTDKIVVYRLPEGFVRQVAIPSEEFDEEKVKQYIAEDLKELLAWRGKKLRISVPTGTPS